MHTLIESWILSRVVHGVFIGKVEDFADLLHSEIELRGYWDSLLESIDDSDFALMAIKNQIKFDGISTYRLSAHNAAEMMMDEYVTEVLEDGDSIDEHNNVENIFRNRESADHINGENGHYE